jgi:hypothetical protein
MAVKYKKDKPDGRIEIDLTGPDGNAFVLLSLASQLCKKLGYDDDHKKRILDEMRLTDYEGLIWTFDREFGMFVTLWR